MIISSVLKFKRTWLFLTGIIVSLPLTNANADAGINFHGSLIVVECTVNNDSKQVVDFGNAVGIHRIDGKRFEQPIPFKVECKNYAGGEVPALTLTLEGNATTFNDAAVKTNVNGLGIELRSNGRAQSLNQPLTFDYKSVPVLTAVPVADPSLPLSAQSFTATVKLTVEIA